MLEKNEVSILFAEACDNQKIFPLNILKFLKHQSFILENYKINDKICVALASSLPYAASDIKTLIMDNNGLTDTGITTIVKSLKSSKLEKIIYSRNHFGPGFIGELAKFFHNKENKLVELNFSGSFTDQANIPLFMDTLLMPHCKLKYLSIAKLKISF